VTGEPQTLPATQPVPVYEARVEDGQIVVIVP
jgi:nitrite reductase/ring-hydroxylating ferredoxin subunit